MARTETVELTNMCMLEKDGHVLVLNKKLKDGYGITFPGGHVEKHEPVYDSMIREFREETGLTLVHPVFCGIKEWIDDDDSRYMVFLYRAEQYTGQLTISREGDVYWVKKESLLSLPWIWHLDRMMEVFDQRAQEVFLDDHDGYKPIVR